MRADPTNRHCAACYGQTEGGGIDFEAAFDGPTLKNVEVAAGMPMAIDDLYICRGCLRIAAGMLDPPLINAPALIAEKARLEGLVAEAAELEAKNIKIISDLQRANGELVTRAGGQPGPIVAHAREVKGESERLKAEREAQGGPNPAARRETEPVPG